MTCYSTCYDASNTTAMVCFDSTGASEMRGRGGEGWMRGERSQAVKPLRTLKKHPRPRFGLADMERGAPALERDGVAREGRQQATSGGLLATGPPPRQGTARHREKGHSARFGRASRVRLRTLHELTN